ncbi:F0F1 ATP synthase subunit gamma [Oceanibacterium hippocampi]|uniref:ATP synthase gamma chain n=1 Tax=Oceanibacterium hippocampi TaxID=745714 RepID=A0A1Y5RBJ8_9PROT|nr:F0F1 ATP synthase subunit gamma [Oceanibacterium hippocampi]SLN13592.1 ATP synthase gamma chain [Oceanibacterium hippocampi]
MANLKALKVRINSVKSTQKITKAMKMVAASKLRRAQEAAERGRPYAEMMGQMMGALGAGMVGRDDAPRLLAGTGGDQTHLLVIATAERGLCGAFNSSIVRAALRRVDALQAEGKTVKIFCVGKKGYDVVRRNHGNLVIERTDFGSVRNIGFEQAHEVAMTVMKLFEAGEFDVCTIYYNAFHSVLSQVVTPQRLIPVELPENGESLEAALDGAAFEFEPDEEEILADLLPRNLSVQVFKALLENAASEQGARMTAMDNATRNAGDMIDKLTLRYNRERQAAITTELTEIISGAEAV